jgi:DNA-binding transcriptional LysR family regulator
MGAARATGVSQPTLGRHIAELESQLNLLLFERTGRGLQPTSHALALAEAARAMQAFIDANPPGVHGTHDYQPDQYGIDPAVVRSEFREYIDHFDLPPE